MSRVLAALGLGLWCLLVLPPALVLTDASVHWLIVLGLGVVAPVLLLWQFNRAIALRGRTRRAEADVGAKEPELLRALRDRGELTPAQAALSTSLTIDEAASLLDALAQARRLRVVERDGGPAYALLGPDRPAIAASVRASVRSTDVAASGAEPGADLALHLVEPISEREREVLALLATGRSNREIADVLVLSIGTVKTHTNSIYRKLGVRNRTEAIVRARDLAIA